MDKIHGTGRANKASYGGGALCGSSNPNQDNNRGSSKVSDRAAMLVRRQGLRQRVPKAKGRNSRKLEVPLADAAICSYLRSYLHACLHDARDTFPGYGNADLLRDIVTTSRRLAAEGTKFATKCLPELFDGLLGYLETGLSDYPSFSKQRGAEYPKFLKGLFAPIYADPCSVPAIKCVRLLYQFCVAFKKLQGKADNKVLRKQLADFVQTDSDLSNIDWSTDATRDIARQARKLIGEVTHGLNPFDEKQASDFRPRPGPGSTNTPTKHAHRFRPVVWYDELFQTFNPDEWFYPPAWAPRKWNLLRTDFYSPQMSERLMSRRSMQKDRKFVHGPDHKPQSRFKFVPKTSLKWRGICIEENELQWHQQALRRCLYKTVERHPKTRGMVNFTTQLINRNLALEGSVVKKWSTIDMSAASDRISRKLVSYLFGENKELLLALESCSSEEVELPKVPGFKFVKILPVKKIAPMGSAICFPIMALVHFALIKAILSRSSLPRALTRKVYVYGDDIIVRRECAQAIYDYLPLFGMKINTEKSFSHSYFRESCGLHAYKGVDVTPIRFKSLLDHSSSPAELATALRLEESLHYNGWDRMAGVVREIVLDVAQKYGIKHVPFVHTESQLFGFFRKDGDARLVEFSKHHKRRWIPGYDRENRDQGKFPKKCPKYSHTWEYRGVVVIVDSFDEDSSFLGEEDRYLRYLTQDGIWASQKYDEGYSRNTKFVRKKLPVSALGYRC